MRNSTGTSPSRAALRSGRGVGRDSFGDPLRDPFRPGVRLEEIAQTLASAYDGILAEGVPDRFAAMLRDPRWSRRDRTRRCGRLALVIEEDDEVRALAETIIEETALDVLGCATSERALGVLRERGPDIALVFLDIRSSRSDDGLALAHAVARTCPEARIVVTSGVRSAIGAGMPDGVRFIAKPWRVLDVLIEAERAADEGLPPASSQPM